jgi:predicted DNA-binding protein
MGVISIRFNNQEENILNFLTEHLEKDKSSVIKDTLLEKYEDLQDLKVIKKFESIEKKGKASFIPADKLLKSL